jgi:hypothetical protein
MNRWIANRATEILGSEDDVVIELIFDLVEGSRHVSTDQSTYLPSFIGTDMKHNSAARYQVPPDSAHRLPRQRHPDLLQGTLEAFA